MKSFFTNAEMRCPCCGIEKMDIAFMIYLNRTRGFAGFPFIVNSGYRCEKHNKEVGSTSTNHTRGMAADIYCIDASKRFDMISAMLCAGMTGIGVGPKFIHCDINHETTMIWTY